GLGFTSPAELLLPHGIRSNTFIQASMHPALAQIQDVFGTPGGQSRPKAPFDYTNIWGECLSLSLPWLLVALRDRGRRGRLVSGAVLAAALVGVVYSLNRGVRLGALVCVAYLSSWLAHRGRLAPLGCPASGRGGLA